MAFPSAGTHPSSTLFPSALADVAAIPGCARSRDRADSARSTDRGAGAETSDRVLTGARATDRRWC